MNHLHSLEPKEVSFVKRAANRKKFIVYKKDQAMTKKELLAHLAACDPQDLERAHQAISKAATLGPDESRLSDSAQTALKAVARIVAPFKNEISADDLSAVMSAMGIGSKSPAGKDIDDTDQDDVDAAAGIDLPAREVEMSAHTNVHKGDSNVASEKDDDKKAQGDEPMWKADAPKGVDEKMHKQAMKMAKNAYMAHMKTKDGAEKSDAADTDKDDEGKDMADKSVNKSAVALDSLPEDQREQLEAVFKSHQELAERNAELVQKSQKLADDLKVERDIRLHKEFIAKAESFSHLSADKEVLADVLKGFHDRGDVAGMQKLEGVLKAADAQAKMADRHGLLSELGSRQGAPKGSGAQAELDALVDGHVAKSNGGSRAAAMDAVLKTDAGRALYAQIYSELQAAGK